MVCHSSLVTAARVFKENPMETNRNESLSAHPVTVLFLINGMEISHVLQYVCDHPSSLLTFCPVQFRRLHQWAQLCTRACSSLGFDLSTSLSLPFSSPSGRSSIWSFQKQEAGPTPNTGQFLSIKLTILLFSSGLRHAPWPTVCFPDFTWYAGWFYLSQMCRVKDLDTVLGRPSETIWEAVGSVIVQSELHLDVWLWS